MLTYYLSLLGEADNSITLNVDCLFKLKRVKIKVRQAFRRDVNKTEKVTFFFLAFNLLDYIIYIQQNRIVCMCRELQAVFQDN